METVKQNNEINKATEIHILWVFNTFTSLWMTLISPIAVGVFVSGYYASKELSRIEIAMFLVFIAIHSVLTYLALRNTSKVSLTHEVEKIIRQNDNYEKVVLPRGLKTFEVSRLQQMVTYLMTLELEEIIDEINENPEDYSGENKHDFWSKGFDRILKRLEHDRVGLFDYKAEDRWNICLYLYSGDLDQLVITWRKNDDRLVTSGRRWKPGQGHVGLTFIMNELKVCHDITKSSELSSSSAVEGDIVKYRSFLSVPIRDSSQLQSGGKPLGVLVFTSSSANQFSMDRDKVFCSTVAKILSIYIDKIIKGKGAK